MKLIKAISSYKTYIKLKEVQSNQRLLRRYLEMFNVWSNSTNGQVRSIFDTLSLPDHILTFSKESVTQQSRSNRDIKLHLCTRKIKSLKVVSATFLLVYFRCLKESTFETRKNAFYFTSKALFVLEIIKF